MLAPPPDADSAGAPADEAARRSGAGLDQILREVRSETLIGLRVLDRHGIVVATTREEMGLSLAARDEVRRAYWR